MAKRNWWNETSAADDGALDDDDAYIVDEDETVDTGWLDDFRFDDYRLSGASASIGGFWGAYGSADRTDTAKRIAAAQRVVQGFVNTFATGDLPYRVTFDESVATAGTDFASRSVVISHRPLFDPSLTDDEANTILTAMACHEADHVRYGRHTAAAVDAAFAGDRNLRAAQRISNILDDSRIERRHVEDYPGYDGIYTPAIDYVARTMNHGAVPAASALSPIDVICGAVRYTNHVDWTGSETERDFWLDWAARGSADDSAETHVAAVREAVERLASQPEPEPEPQDGQGNGEGGSQSGAGESGSGQPSGSESGESGSESAESDETESGSEPTNGTGTGGTVDDTSTLPTCYADAIDDAARENGETSGLETDEAQELIEQAKALVDLPDGNHGEVYWSADGVVDTRDDVEANGAAAAAVRSAFSRSRTGHFDVERGHKSGRLDNRSLVRVASNDYRLFNRRTAPSEGRYLVWLLVDCSGSMNGRPIEQATQVASAVAQASRGLPQLRLDIWGWSTGFRLGGRFGATRVWTTGAPISNVGFLPNVPGSGTPDAEVLQWATKAIKAAARRDETPVIIIASDGQGTLKYAIENGEDHIAAARKAGVEVVSVALGSGIHRDAQERMYGPKGYIPWAGSIAATAGPLGKLIGRIASGR
jgi:hypothetical protein